MAKMYKDLNIYSCMVLNMLSSALGIDLQQPNLQEKMGPKLDGLGEGLSKSEVMHAIRSNHNMTEKILSHLEGEGFIRIVRGERGYQVVPTMKGLLHVREFNRFYASIYAKQIEEHYRYLGLPSWYLRYK